MEPWGRDVTTLRAVKTLQRAVRSGLFDRKVNTELFFDSEATADAVMLVAGVAAFVNVALVVLGSRGFSLVGLLEAALYAIVAWLLLAAGSWLAATKLFDGSGQIQTAMRLHGHAELPLLLAAFGSTLGVIGLVWSIAAKVPATAEATSVGTTRAVGSVLVGLALVVLIRLIFRLPFMALSSIF